MEIGLCSEEITRSSIDEVLHTISNYGFKTVQLNLVNVYGEEIPKANRIETNEMQRIGKIAKQLNLKIIGLNATFNMLENNPETLNQNLDTFERMASITRFLGEECKILTLCTGSRNPYSRWFSHPYNQTQEAWIMCKKVAAKLVEIADRFDLYLGIETEVNNVVSSPEKARKLIDEIGSSRIKIILDISNMVNEGEATPDDIKSITNRAFENLGNDIYVAHGKDIKAGPAIDRTSAGTGIIDFGLILKLLREYGYSGSIVLHHMKQENEIPASYNYMKSIIEQQS
jgi:sugar phosphate isomerase/epimerase